MPDISILGKVVGIPQKRLQISPQICQKLRVIILTPYFTIAQYNIAIGSNRAAYFLHTYVRTWAACVACYPLSSKKVPWQAPLCTLAPHLRYNVELRHHHRRSVHAFNFMKSSEKNLKSPFNTKKSSIHSKIWSLKRNDHRSNVKFTQRLYQYFTMEYSCFFSRDRYCV